MAAEVTHAKTSALREIATLGPAAAALGFLLLVAVRGDAFPGEIVLAVGAILLFQALPGILLWRLVRPVDGWLVEDLAMGLAIGVALSVPVQVATVASDLAVLGYAVPLATVAVVLGLPRSRARVLSRQVSALPWWWGLSLAVPFVAGILAFLPTLAAPIRWTGYTHRYIDRGFHEGLVGELLHRFPLRYPQVASEEVAYHWFSHAWTAHIASLSATPIDVTTWLVTPALLNITAPLLLAVVAVRLSGRAWAGPIAATVTYLASRLQPWHTIGNLETPLALESPSQELASLLFPALLAVIALRWQGVLGRGSTSVLLLLLLVTSGTKGTTISVLIPGLLLAALAAGVFARGKLRIVLTDLVLTVGVFVITTVFIFGGETKNLQISPLEWMVGNFGSRFGVEAPPWSTPGLLLVALWLLGLVLVGGAVVAALCTTAGRADPILWLLIGCSTAGAGALLVFVQVAQSHVYFYKISLIPFGLAVGYAVGQLAKAPNVRRPLVLGISAGIAAAAVFATVRAVVGSRPSEAEAWLSLTGTALLVALLCSLGLRRRGRSDIVLACAVGLVAAATLGPLIRMSHYEQPTRVVTHMRGDFTWIHSSDVAALRWLRDHSDPDDLVATNRHCRGRTIDGCDRRRFDIAAYSERRVLVEGWAYTPKADAQYNAETGERWTDFWDADLIATNDGFFTAPDRAGSEDLRDLGVRWLVMSNLAPHADTLEPWAELRLENRHLSIYEIVPEAG